MTTFRVTRMVDRGVVRWRVRGTVAGERKSFGLFDARDDAERMAEALERKASGSPRGMTLASFGEAWLDKREKSGAYASIDDMQSVWRLRVAGSSLAAMALREIRAVHVADWLDGLTGARQTRLHALNLVRRCLADAQREGRTAINAAIGLRIHAKVEPDKWTHLSQAEIDDVAACEAIPHRSRLAFVIAIYTGLRAGELWGLRWENVHLDAETPHLEVRVSYGKGTKSERGKRVVPLLPPAIAAFKEWRGPGRRIGLVWPSKHDKRVHRNGYDAQWPKWRKAAGILRAVRFHDLRHTCATMLVSGAWGRVWRLEEVREWLGHSSINVTQRYARLRPDTILAAGKDAGQRFATKSTEQAGQIVGKLHPRKHGALPRK